MSRLGPEFGMTGNGLAKICDRLDVPYPPRGYWAKKEAGKPVVEFRLPPKKAGIAASVDIRPSPPKVPTAAPAAELKSAALAEMPPVTAIDEHPRLHRRVREWIKDHEREQKRRKSRSGGRSNDLWSWGPKPLADLTDRDMARLRITSALLTTVEGAGGSTKSAHITGRLTFVVAGHDVEVRLAEKMRRPIRAPQPGGESWTAYPDHHQRGLAPSGFLRASIVTWLDQGMKREWVETAKQPMAKLLPQIAATILAAGDVLTRQEREREEQRLRHAREAAERYERQRLKEIENRRWERFREMAGGLDEVVRLRALAEAMRVRLSEEGDMEIAERRLSEWLAWAEKRIAEMDPLSGSVEDAIRRIVGH